jgi:type II secretory pathway pseudopilin PulG
MQARDGNAFTIIELLIVVSIITLLAAILLPAIGKARESALVNESKNNLRQMAVAHRAYAADWADRHVTYVRDTLGLYGGDVQRYNDEVYGGGDGFEVHPPIIAGWGYDESEAYVPFGWWSNSGSSVFQPISFPTEEGEPHLARGGWYRLGIQTRPMHAYFNGRCHDPVFYAPKDRKNLDRLAPCFEAPGEVAACCPCGPWSSYCMSPAGLFSPAVFSFDPGTNRYWRAPWTLAGGYRVPSFGHVRYPTLKTHMLEHDWLQNTKVPCNDSYVGCEPYYFNQSYRSMPATLLYDGSVRLVGVIECMSSDRRHLRQAGYGLWSRDTPFGENGWFIAEGYDFAESSFHILTTQGVLGRDTLGRE